MTDPDKPVSPFLALARQIAAADSDDEAAAIFNQATGLTGDPDVDRDELARRATVRARGDAEWDCVAYGPELGTMCFFALVNPCSSKPDCKTRMAAERKRVYRRIKTMAAAGDPTGVHLAAEFTHPDQLLNASPDEQDKP